MEKYYTQNVVIKFYRTKTGKPLSNIKYKISLISAGIIGAQFEGVTDKAGHTKPLLIDRNGELQVYVEGFKTPFSKKGWIQPELVEKYSHIIKIDKSNLNNNKLMTEEKYNQKKAKLKSDIKIQKEKSEKILENLRKNNKVARIDGWPGFGYSLSGTSAAGTNKGVYSNYGKSRLDQELESYGNDYNEYKKNNTKQILPTMIRDMPLKTYSIYQFVNNNGKGIPLINFQVFEDGNSKPILNLKPSAADNNGLTRQAYTYKKNRIKYRVGSTENFSSWYEPHTCVEPQVIQKIVIGTSVATTNPDSNHTVNMGSVENPPIVINPHTNEVLILPPEIYAEFDKKTKLLSKAVSDVHSTNKELRKKIQARSITEIEQLEKNLNLNQKKAINKINGEFNQVSDIREVWVVETTGKTNTQASKANFARRYLKAKEYDELKKNKLNKNAQVSITSSGPGISGKGKIESIKKIEESFKKLSDDLKVTLAQKKIGNNDSKAIYNLIGGLGGEIATEYTNSNGTDISYEAQWMRMVAGSGANGSMSVSNKGVSLKANANASVKWSVFEGVKEWKWFHPSEDGWNLQYENYNLGIIRFLIGTEVSGSIGANLGIAGNLSVDISHATGKQLISATVRDPVTSLAKVFDKAKKIKLEPASGSLTDTGENQAKAELKAFAGAQLQGLLKGGIEWYNQYNKESGGKEDPKFVSIASASTGGGVSAGAGAEGKFRIVYDSRENKFKFLVAAHLCWGIGAKGIASFEVAADQLLNYMGFIKSQLAYAGFKTLIFLHKEAFRLISELLAYCIGQNHPITIAVDRITVVFNAWITALDRDQGRLNTARNINSHLGKQELIYATPETKGILLYAVTHWSSSSAAIFDIEYKFSEGEINFFPERKTAVINILKTCLSAEEWKNTIQHIHPQGRKLSIAQMGKVEGDLIRFLNYRPNGDGAYAADVIGHINQGKVFKGGQNNHWMHDYIKYRDAVKNIKGSLDYMLVKNQDEIGFQQILIAHDLKGGLEPEQLYASNLDLLGPITMSDEPEYLV